MAFLRIPVSLHTQSDDESSGSSGSVGFPLSKMVEMFEPNSVASQHLEQEHQKFLVIARWSRLAMVPQRAWVYMVERCSPSEKFLVIARWSRLAMTKNFW